MATRSAAASAWCCTTRVDCSGGSRQCHGPWARCTAAGSGPRDGRDPGSEILADRHVTAQPPAPPAAAPSPPHVAGHHDVRVPGHRRRWRCLPSRPRGRRPARGGARDRRLGRRCVDTTPGQRVFRYPRPCLTSVDVGVTQRPSGRPRHRAARLRRRRQSADRLRGAKTIVAPGRTIGPGSPLAERGAANGDNAADAVRLTARWARTRRSTLIGPFGRRQVIRGRLTDATGVGVRNARIELLTAIDHRVGQPIDKGGARTRGDGRFTIILPRDVSSRTLVLRYRSHANDTVAAAEHVARTEGPGRSQPDRDATRGHARPRRCGSAGRLVGRPLPAGRQGHRVAGAKPGPSVAHVPHGPHRPARTIRNVVHLPARRSCSVRDARPGEGNGRLSVRNRVLAARPRPRALSGPLPFPAHEPGPRHRRRRHHRRGRRAPPAARSRLRGARLRPARGARLDARGLRGPHRRPARARRGARGDAGLHARDPPGGDRRRDRELPQAAPHADRGQQRALQRGRARGPRPRRRALHLRLELDGLRARDRVPDDRGAHRRHADPALGLRVLQAHGRGVRARGARRARPALHDLPPVQRLRPRRDARRRAGHRPHGPRRHPQVPEPAARARRCRSSATARRRARSRTSTTSPTGSSPRRPRRRASTTTSTSRPPTSARWPSWRRSSGRRAGATPTSSRSSTCRASTSTSCAAGPRSRRPGAFWGGRRASACTRASRRLSPGCAGRCAQTA